jgi:hypothetical protein
MREKVSSYLFDLVNIPKKSNHFNIEWRNMNTHEDVAWFGILGFLLFYPLMLIHGIDGIKKWDPIKLGLSISIVSYICIWEGLIYRNQGWSIFQGRYFILAFLLFAPFIASIYKKGLLSRIVCWILVLLSIYIAGYTTINNLSKPLTGNAAIWKLDRLQMVYANNIGQIILIQGVDKYVPANAKLGLLLVNNTYEYPFFGKELDRQLIPIYPDSMLSNDQWIDQTGLNWILVCTPTKVIPTGYEEILIPKAETTYQTGNCRLLKKMP